MRATFAALNHRRTTGSAVARSRLRIPAVLLALLGLAGCCALPDAKPCIPRIFLIGSSMPGTSKGLDALAKDLRWEGYAVSRAGRWDRWRISRYLIRDAKSGFRRSPIVLVGHSGGGRDCIAIARRLGEEQIAVDGLICLDTYWLGPISGNVRRAVQIYFSSHRLYHSRPLKYESGAHGFTASYDLDKVLSKAQRRDADHFRVDDHPVVQAIVIREVRHCLWRSSSGRVPTGIGPGGAE